MNGITQQIAKLQKPRTPLIVAMNEWKRERRLQRCCIRPGYQPQALVTKTPRHWDN